MRNRDVEHADQLKSEFLSSMSHELRTPLHTIIGFADLLVEEMKGPLNPSQKRFAEHIQRDSRHLLAIINDILDLSKIEAGRLELHSNRLMLPSLSRKCYPAFGTWHRTKDIILLEELAGSMGITADRMRFKEIVYNLSQQCHQVHSCRGKDHSSERDTPGRSILLRRGYWYRHCAIGTGARLR